MREIFSVIIQSNGGHYLYIRTPSDRADDSGGVLLNEDNPLAKSEITKQLLSMLAEAYNAGYEEAVGDGRDAISRLLLESNKHHKPNNRITEKIDYRGD